PVHHREGGGPHHRQRRPRQQRPPSPPGRRGFARGRPGRSGAGPGHGHRDTGRDHCRQAAAAAASRHALRTTARPARFMVPPHHGCRDVSGTTRLIDTLLEKGVLALLVFTPLAFGTVQKWSVSLLEIGAFLLLTLLLLKQLLAGEPVEASRFPLRISRILKVLCLLFAGLVVLQLLPLPPPLIR